MTYSAFLVDLGKAGLTVRAFADLLGMNRNSVSNYARADEVPRHLALTAALFAEMNVQGLDFRAVAQRIDMAPKKPRGAAKPGRFGGERQDQLEFDS
jgi:transcriptional regulator with XRE-family HTH domain